MLSENYKGLPVSTHVVMNLISSLVGKGYCLTMDNCYIPPQLADNHNVTDGIGKITRVRQSGRTRKIYHSEQPHVP